MSSYGNIQWADDMAHRHYVVTWDDEGAVDMGSSLSRPNYGFASLGEIVDKIANDNHPSNEDYEADPVKVWRLTMWGPVPVVLSFHPHSQSELVEVRFTWREPNPTGRGKRTSESGFYPIR